MTLRLLRSGWLLPLTVAGLVSCGRTPVAPRVADASGITLASLPPGHLASVTIGERIPLSATFTPSAGQTSDCTNTAVWQSSDERVAKFSSTPGELLTLTGGTVTISATCQGTKSEAVLITVGGGVKIAGFEDYSFLLPGQGGLDGTRLPLTALLIDANGAPGAACTNTATWSTSDPAVAEVRGYESDYSPLIRYTLIGRKAGTTVVTVHCGTATGQTMVRVQALRVTGVVRDINGVPAGGAQVVLGGYPAASAFGSDSPLVTTGADGAFSTEWGTSRVCLRAGRADTTVDQPACVTWDHRQLSVAIDATLTPLSTVLQSGTATTCQRAATSPTCPLTGLNQSPGLFFTSFQAQSSRPLWIRVDWTADRGEVTASLTCSQRDFTSTKDSSGMLVMQVSGNSSCNYLLTISHSGASLALPFVYRISQ